MKGVVFTELLNFVSSSYGDDMVDDIIDDATLPHGGAYTAVGTYPYTEMQRLVVSLATRSEVGVGDLLTRFGHHLCQRFVGKYPEFFASQPCLFDLLESVDRHIHVEVHKLYPDAELPLFQTSARDTTSLCLDYTSCRPLAALAEGMIRGAADHYGETVTIQRMQVGDDDVPVVRFSIRLAA